MQSIPTIFIRDKETKVLVNKPLRMVDWVFQGRGVPTRKFNGVAIKVERGHVWRRFEWRQGENVPERFVKCQDFDPKRPNAPISGWVPVSKTFETSPKGRDERALQEAWKDKIQQLTHVAVLKHEIDMKSKPSSPYKVSFTPKIDTLPDGTYELCGPQIRGNPEKLTGHVLYKHGETLVKSVPRTFDGLKKFLETYEGEGIVWHYKMSTHMTLMAKIKRRDFGFEDRKAGKE